mmetsp:Transcript_21282/g.33305  ORF Transcript_21282/g.33305 Transcript_21282/m.33305 type:complete len:146 (-) Transcript_21282:581-1018(-)
MSATIARWQAARKVLGLNIARKTGVAPSTRAVILRFRESTSTCSSGGAYLEQRRRLWAGGLHGSIRLFSGVNGFVQDVIQAAKDGDQEKIEKVAADGTSLSCTDARGRTPLHWACENQHLSVNPPPRLDPQLLNLPSGSMPSWAP